MEEEEDDEDEEAIGVSGCSGIPRFIRLSLIPVMPGA